MKMKQAGRTVWEKLALASVSAVAILGLILLCFTHSEYGLVQPSSCRKVIATN